MARSSGLARGAAQAWARRVQFHAIPVLLRPLPGGRATFSWRAKRTSPPVRRERAGTPKAAQRAEGRTSGVKAGHPADEPCALPCTAGPLAAAGVRRWLIRVTAANWPTSRRPSFGLFRRPPAASGSPHWRASCVVTAMTHTDSSRSGPFHGWPTRWPRGHHGRWAWESRGETKTARPRNAQKRCGDVSLAPAPTRHAP